LTVPTARNNGVDAQFSGRFDGEFIAVTFGQCLDQDQPDARLVLHGQLGAFNSEFRRRGGNNRSSKSPACTVGNVHGLPRRQSLDCNRMARFRALKGEPGPRHQLVQRPGAAEEDWVTHC
jgi:hypothetical protein